jgi:acetyltransferase-like isoleucine patch superfamily enzyme
MRVLRVFRRYGWRSIFVVVAVAARRMFAHYGFCKGWLSRFVTLGTKGRRIFIGRDVELPFGAEISFGSDVRIGPRSVFEVGVTPRARVTVGSNVWFSRDFHLTSLNEIRIGSDVLVGEFVSIRDSSHSFAVKEIAIRSQGDEIGSVTVEDNVWIGRGCLILGRPEGITIAKGTIIAANSVVRSSTQPYEIVGGVPARRIRVRTK